jgi:hypothetical protein
VGVDLDPSMLAVARRAAPDLTWLKRDLAAFDPAELGAAFDVVLLAGNVVPLLDEVPVTIDDYDAACARHGLLPVARFSTWGRAPFDAGAGYAVSVHQGSGPAPE